MRSMSVSYYTSFFFSCYGAHRLLHSFPTRRSSDLPTLLYGMILGLAIPLLALQVVTAVEPGPRLVAAGFIVWLLLLPSALMLARVRRLRAAGFDRDELTDALAAGVARHRRGLALLHGE